MKVTLKALSGSAEANLERAKHELSWVLSFRGNVTGSEASGSRVIVEFEINPKWELSPEEKVSYLKEWIPAKVRGGSRCSVYLFKMI